MFKSLSVIIVDDDPEVCEVITEIIEGFYTSGEVLAFTNADEAASYCRDQGTGLAIFVLDVFLKDATAFTFLDSISDIFPMAYEDSIIITGKASDDVVNSCIACDITYFLEKPIRSYALQHAVRSIMGKYMKFAKKLLEDPAFTESI